MTRQVLGVLLLSALVGVGGAGGAGAGGTPLAFVAIPATSEIAEVYLGTGHVRARLRVPRGPQELASSGEFVLVASPAAGAVTLIDARSRRIVKVWRGFGKPSDVVVAGTRAYVTDAGRGQLIVLDLHRRRVARRIDVGGRPHAIAVGDLAVIADERRSSLTLVNLSTGRVVGRFPAGGIVSSISKRPDTADVLVSYRDGSIARVDWGRRRVAFRRDIGSIARDVVFDFYAGDRVWVADSSDGQVRLISSRNGRSLRRAARCPGAHRLALVHTWRIVATCPGSSSLADWDTMSGQLRRTRLGGAPAGVAFVLLK